MTTNKKSSIFDMNSFIFASLTTMLFVIIIAWLHDINKPEYCDIYHSGDYIVKDVDKDSIKSSAGYIRYDVDGKERIFSLSSGYAVLCK